MGYYYVQCEILRSCCWFIIIVVIIIFLFWIFFISYPFESGYYWIIRLRCGVDLYSLCERYVNVTLRKLSKVNLKKVKLHIYHFRTIWRYSVLYLTRQWVLGWKNHITNGRATAKYLIYSHVYFFTTFCILTFFIIIIGMIFFFVALIISS